METNLFVYIISHIPITGYKTKTTSALHAFKIHHKLSVVSSLNVASYPGSFSWRKEPGNIGGSEPFTSATS